MKFHTLQEKLEQAAKGKQSAQIDIYKHFAQSLFSVSYGTVREGGLGEEIVQDVFLKFFTEIKKKVITPEYAPPYLRRMVINLSIDHLRKRKVDFECVVDLPDTISEDVSIYSEENIETMYSAIDQLPLGYKTIIYLKVNEEMSTEEIATRLGISQYTVRSQYKRAKDLLTLIIIQGERI